jgi:hypothetical protein
MKIFTVKTRVTATEKREQKARKKRNKCENNRADFKM